MHILLTNDDGPPSDHASPYLKTFVEVLTSPPFNHTVSVVIPSQQRSWIGKAHFLPSTYHFPGNAHKPAPPPNHEDSSIITPAYYDPATGSISASIPSTHETTNGTSTPNTYWVLIPGTPATCAQLGLFHHDALFPSHPTASPAHPEGPIDLVISGPNFGRNTSASFALSSGTVGGALEAAVVGKRAIAVSFAHYRERPPTSDTVHNACVLSARLVDKLWTDWRGSGGAGEENPAGTEGDTPDLYSINIPLVEQVAEKPVQWTFMFNTCWRGGRLYSAVKNKGAEGEAEETSAPRFQWAPDFHGHFKFQQKSPVGSDTRAIMEYLPSVTPLKADYRGLYGRSGFQGEFRL